MVNKYQLAPAMTERLPFGVHLLMETVAGEVSVTGLFKR
jgi:hypothetical protein